MIPHMPEASVEALQSVPLFDGLDNKALKRLAKQMRERRFPEGSIITAEGETGAGFFVIAEGTASVSVGDDVVSTLGPGEHFGEVALIDEGRRSASVTATTDLRCYGLTPWEFRPFVEEHPAVAWALLQTMARRLRTSQG
jgi:CRP-like cAMP-binding protein